MNLRKAFFTVSIFLCCFPINQLFSEKRSFYPYQNPHRFTNKKYISSGYYLMGDIKIESEDNRLFYEVKSDLMLKNKPIIIRPNGNFNIFDAYKKSLEKPVEFESGKTIVFRPNISQYPSIVVQGKNNLITIYIKKAADKTNGNKLIFDVDAFEKYMTQTWWFDDLHDLHKTVGGIPTSDERFFSFGFTINVDNTVPFKGSDNKPLERVFNISSIYKDKVFNVKLLQRVFIKDVTELLKSYDEHRNKREYISYEDFFKGKTPIIVIQPMDDRDRAQFDALIKQ